MMCLRFLCATLLVVSTVSCRNIPESSFPQDATEVLLVDHASGSRARARFYVFDGRWRRVFSCRAAIGRSGLGKTVEGDGKTPCGVFHATGAFGVRPCPGGNLPYLLLTPSIFACDEPGEYYNTLIDTSVVHHRCKGEDMYRIVPSYNYGMTIDFNPERVFPKGSNIFVHCFGASRGKSTSGCIALPERRMKRLLTLASCSTAVVVLD